MTLVAEQDQPVSLDDVVRDANRLLHEGDLDSSLALLAPLTSEETAYLPARFLLAMVAWKMGRLDWSVDLMRDCHEKWPMHGTVADVLASLYAQAGNLRESLFMGKLATALGGPGEFIDLIPNGFPTFDFAFYNIKERPKLTQAQLSAGRGKLLDAIESARQHSALNPQDGDAYVFLVTLLLRAGMASVAESVLRSVEGHIADGGEFPPACASLYARALTAVGEFSAAQSWHERAVAAAPDNADIAAAQIADAFWTDHDAAALKAAAKMWSRHFCPPPKPQEWRPIEGKLVVGYLVSAAMDPADAAAIAAVARAHDRERVSVIGYGTGEQTWDENALLSGAFDTWHDVSSLDPATLARFLLRSGLHLVVDTTGFTAAKNLTALSSLQTVIRVAWLGNAAGLAEPIYDRRIAFSSTAEQGDTLWRIRGAYPVLRPVRDSESAATRDGINFGADVQMAQLDDTTVGLWSFVLRAEPKARLLLRARDMGPDGNIERLIARFGRELAARIDIVDVKAADEFYSRLDVALMPHRGVSPRLAAEALAYGVPPVAVAGASLGQPYASFLQDLGLASMLVAADKDHYVSIATRMAAPGKMRDKAIAAIATAKDQATARHFAAALEQYAVDTLGMAQGDAS